MYGYPQADQVQDQRPQMSLVQRPQVPPQAQRPQSWQSIITNIREEIDKRIKNRMDIRRERIENRNRKTTFAPPFNSAVHSSEVSVTSTSDTSAEPVIDAEQVEASSTANSSAAVIHSPLVEETIVTVDLPQEPEALTSTASTSNIEP